jgi:hypothetical protein
MRITELYMKVKFWILDHAKKLQNLPPSGPLQIKQGDTDFDTWEIKVVTWQKNSCFLYIIGVSGLRPN